MMTETTQILLSQISMKVILGSKALGYLSTYICFRRDAWNGAVAKAFTQLSLPKQDNAV